MRYVELRRWSLIAVPLGPVSDSQEEVLGKGMSMKSLALNVMSFFRQGLGLLPKAAGESATDVIISGYSMSQPENENSFFDRRPVAILYADIADYARMTELDEEGTHLRLIECMNILKAHIAANNGRIAHSAGDAILAEFGDADNALHCAINVQLASRQWNTDPESNQNVRFRIGINFGEVISDRGDIFGKAVNLAARLEGLACSGGICISDSVLSRLEDCPSYKIVALGKQYVKNISEPVQAFWIEVDPEQFVDHDFTGAVKVSAATS